MSFAHGGCESRQISFVKIALGWLGVKAMAFGFRSAVNGVMFRAGDPLDIFGIVSLKTANKSDAKLRREERVFAVGFLPAAPARVADNVEVGGVEVEADVLARVAIVFGAAFRGDDISFLVNQRHVPGGRHADGLGKDGGDSSVAYAVQTFIAMTVSGDAEPWNAGRIGQDLRRLFLQRQPAHEIANAGLQRLRWILPDFRAGDGWHFRRSRVNVRKGGRQIRRAH